MEENDDWSEGTTWMSAVVRGAGTGVVWHMDCNRRALCLSICSYFIVCGRRIPTPLAREDLGCSFEIALAD